MDASSYYLMTLHRLLPKKGITTSCHIPSLLKRFYYLIDVIVVCSEQTDNTFTDSDQVLVSLENLSHSLCNPYQQENFDMTLTSTKKVRNMILKRVNTNSDRIISPPAIFFI